jgi:hypothetical protein
MLETRRRHPRNVQQFIEVGECAVALTHVHDTSRKRDADSRDLRQLLRACGVQIDDGYAFVALGAAPSCRYRAWSWYTKHCDVDLVAVGNVRGKVERTGVCVTAEPTGAAHGIVGSSAGSKPVQARALNRTSHIDDGVRGRTACRTPPAVMPSLAGSGRRDSRKRRCR